MGKGDKKTKKGKRFLGSYGNKRPKNKNITKRAIIPLADLRKWSIERLYAETGRYSDTTVLTLRGKSRFAFDRTITGILHYTLEERTKLERRFKNGFIKETDNNIKIEILLRKNLTLEQIKLLRTEGIPNSDIIDLLSYNSNKPSFFKQKGKRKLPKPNIVIKVNQNFLSDCKAECGFYKIRLDKGEKLLSFEKIRFVALAKFLKLKIVDSNFESKYVSPSEKNELNYQYNYLQYLNGDIKLKDKELVKARENKIDSIKKQVEKEFIATGIEQKDIILKYAELYKELILVGMEFNPQVLIYSTPNVYWNFDRFLHIIFRHTWALRISGKYEQKDVIKYGINEIEGLITIILEKVRSDIEHHFQTYPNKRFSKYKEHRYYYEGDYYEFHINPDGLLETFYNSTKQK